MTYLAAAIQTCSTNDPEANWGATQDLIRRAADRGARFVATPENTNFLGPMAEKVALAESLTGPTSTRFAALAETLGIHLLLGSFNEAIPGDPTRCHNTSVLFGPNGSVVAVYRKIHLFDVDLSDSVRFRESDAVTPGDRVVVAETELDRIGLSICYDLRFGELYRRLVDQGAGVICIPSAFTLTTGRDHWETLIRARAIESQAFVIAPAQWGRHDQAGQRESFGHSMIVDPWGHVLAMAADGPGLAVAEIEPERVGRVRQALPVGRNRRLGTA